MLIMRLTTQVCKELANDIKCGRRKEIVVTFEVEPMKGDMGNLKCTAYTTGLMGNIVKIGSVPRKKCSKTGGKSGTRDLWALVIQELLYELAPDFWKQEREYGNELALYRGTGSGQYIIGPVVAHKYTDFYSLLIEFERSGYVCSSKGNTLVIQKG